MMIATMAEINNVSDHSLLWGRAIEFWDWIGIKALIWGAALGVVALLLTASSAFILYRVADVAQKDLESDSRISAIRLSDLTKQAEQLRKDTAEANARAAEATLALEKLKAPRRLTSEQHDSIVSALSKFKGQKYWGMLPASGLDTQALWSILSAALDSAGWVLVDSNGLKTEGRPYVIGVIPDAGIHIQIEPNQKDALAPAAVALTEMLKASGLIADVSLNPNAGNNPTAIAVIIGLKPQ